MKSGFKIELGLGQLERFYLGAKDNGLRKDELLGGHNWEEDGRGSVLK
jgi:hypothetical protein